MAKRNKGAPESQGQAQQTTTDPAFTWNPRLDVYYQTSDGSQFYLEEDARVHTQTLKQKTIQKTINNK